MNLKFEIETQKNTIKKTFLSKYNKIQLVLEVSQFGPESNRTRIDICRIGAGLELNWMELVGVLGAGKMLPCFAFWRKKGDNSRLPESQKVLLAESNPGKKTCSMHQSDMAP